MAITDGMGIKVVVRLRPLNGREKQSNTLPVVTASSQRKQVTVVKGFSEKAVRHAFEFDEVFGAFTSQEEVFNQTLAPVVKDVLKGFESTVFAYGQTGTGKTHTMEGDITTPGEEGVIPRSCSAIFKALKTEGKYAETSVKVSYLEIYNEELSDLLVENSENLKISAQTDGSVKCVGLSEVEVRSTDEVLNIIRASQEKRQTAETKMNKTSSRSHCLFTLSVHSKEHVAGGVVERQGKLHMVDLAGSECAKSTGAEVGSMRFRESKNINKSLLTLGRVITALRLKQPRTPYRDSKLTRLLQEALGGKSKTIIIATLSPSALCVEETLSTLNYADKAHGIKNKPVSATVRMTTSGSTSTSGSSFDGDDKSARRTFAEMEARYHYMTTQCEEAQAALGRKHEELMTVSEKASESERALITATTSLERSQEALTAASAANEAMFTHLEQQQLCLLKRNAVIEARTETEANLQSEAQALINSLKGNIDTSTKLHATLEEEAGLKQELRDATKQFSASCFDVLHGLVKKVNEFNESAKEGQNAMRQHVDKSVNEGIAQISSLVDDSDAHHSAQGAAVEAIGSSFQEQVSQTSTHLHSYAEQNCTALQQMAVDFRKANDDNTGVVQALNQQAGQGEVEIVNWCREAQASLQDTEASFTKTLEKFSHNMEQQTASNHAAAEEHKKKLEATKGKLTKLDESISANGTAEEQHMAAIAGLESNITSNVASQLSIVKSQHNTLIVAQEEQHIVHDTLCSEHTATLKHLLTDLQLRGTEQAAKYAAHKQQLEETISEHRTNAIPVSQLMKEALSGLSTAALTATTSQKSQLNSQLECLSNTITSEHKLGTNDQRFTQHTMTLSKGSEHIKTASEAQNNVLLQQKNRLASTLALHLESGEESTETVHLAAINAMGTHVKSATSTHIGTLEEQAASLEQTTSQHLKGQDANEKKHKATINKASKLMKESNAAQLATLKEQNTEMTTMLKTQQSEQQRILETVMERVKEMLSVELSGLGNLLKDSVESVTSTNDQLMKDTGDLKKTMDKQNKTMLKETDKWCTQGQKTAELLNGISQVNSGVRSAMTDMTGQFEEQVTQLASETTQWGLCAKEVSENLRDATKENGQVNTMIKTMEEEAQSINAGANEEAAAWAESVREATSSIEEAMEANQGVDTDMTASLEDLQARKDAMVGQVADWGTSNELVHTQLEAAIQATDAGADAEVQDRTAVAQQINEANTEATNITGSTAKLGKEIANAIMRSDELSSTIAANQETTSEEMSSLAKQAENVHGGIVHSGEVAKSLISDNTEQTTDIVQLDEAFAAQAAQVTSTLTNITTLSTSSINAGTTSVASLLESRTSIKADVAASVKQLVDGLAKATASVEQQVEASKERSAQETESTISSLSAFSDAQASLRDNILSASKAFKSEHTASCESQKSHLGVLQTGHASLSEAQGGGSETFSTDMNATLEQNEELLRSYCVNDAQMEVVVPATAVLEEVVFSEQISNTAAASEIEAPIVLTAEVLEDLRSKVGLQVLAVASEPADDSTDATAEQTEDAQPETNQAPSTVLKPVLTPRAGSVNIVNNTVNSTKSDSKKGGSKMKAPKSSRFSKVEGSENVAPKSNTGMKKGKRMRAPSASGKSKILKRSK